MSKQQFRLGIDLGSHSIKCALVQGDRDDIVELWETALHPDRKSLRDEVDASVLQARLGTVFREHQGWPHKASTAMQGTGTICRYLELPPMSDKELRVAVPAMANQILPFAVEERVLDFVTVPPLGGREGARGVLLVAALRSKVERLCSTLQSVGVEVSRLETTALAMVRAFVRNHNVPSDECHVLVHLGSHWTHLIGMRGEYPYFVREFAPAGDDFVYACQMGAQVSWEDAEILLRETDVRDPYTLCEPAVGRWLGEVRRSVECFLRQTRGETATLYLSGGGGMVPGLDLRLALETQLKVRRDHWDRLGRKQTNTPMLYNPAIGLALAA